MDISECKYLFVEITNKCNMHCVFCPSDTLKTKRQDIDDVNFKKLIREASEFENKPYIQFNVLGEPLLNHKLYEYLDLCDEYQFRVILITNFSFLNQSHLKKILKHSNTFLVLSLQTPTEQSFQNRGCRSISFNDYIRKIFTIFETKIGSGSETPIELHVSSNYWIVNDVNLQLETPVNIWANFESAAEQENWIGRFMDELMSFSQKMKEKYSGEYNRLLGQALNKFSQEIKNKKIAISPADIPNNPQNLTEDCFWGFMFMPGIFFRFKQFGLWTKDYEFLDSVFPGKALYIEERTEPTVCEMAKNVAVLANGNITVCCLDYQGEINLGNISDTSLKSALQCDARKQIVENAMINKICRRCRGKLFVFDTEKLENDTQDITQFGYGWYDIEYTDQSGVKRWTNGNAAVYVYTRIKANKIRLKYYSVFEKNSLFYLKLYSYIRESDTFKEENILEFTGNQDQVNELIIEYPFHISTIYKIEVCSPTFEPSKLYNINDPRILGLAVFDLNLFI